MQKNNNIYDVVAIGSNFNKPKVYYHSLLNSGSSFDIGTAFSSCEKVVLDIKSIVSSHVSQNKNLSKESNIYSIDESNPFTIETKGSTIYSKEYIKGLISYNKRNSVIEINTGSIFAKGFFPFSITFNLVAEGYTRTTKTLNKPIIKISPNEIGSKLFDGLSVRVSNKNSNSPNMLCIDEFKRFAQNRMFTFIKNESYGCDGVNVAYSASGDYQFDDVGGLKNIVISNNADVHIARGFPIVNIHDRSDYPFLNSYLKYDHNAPRLHTNISHKQYFNSDGLAFYDQVVSRSLTDDQGVNRSHPLVNIKDIFSAIKSNDVHPVLQFRREYGKNEDINNGKVPYYLYFSPEYISASESYVNCFSIDIHRSLLGKLDFEFKIKDRNKHSIELESKTTYSTLKEQKIFYGNLHISTSPEVYKEDFDFGNSEIFYSDDDVAYLDVASRGLSVMDVFNALRKNLGGKVSPQSPNGTFSPTHIGFVPTFKELGIDNYSPNDTVVKFNVHENYDGLALMAAARLWMGNNSEYDISEKSKIYIKGFNARSYIYCKGLKNVVKLNNYVAIAPLNRCLTTAFVRGEIKSFYDHLVDRDFLSIEQGGPGYSKFYKYDTISKSIDIIKYGYSYFSSILKLPDYEIGAMTCPGPASETKSFGEERKLFGASQLGICFSKVNKETEGENGFFNVTPAYVMSHFGIDVNQDIYGKNLSKTCNEIPSATNKLFIFYKNNSMFPGPYGYSDKHYVPSPFMKGINEHGEDEKKYFGGGNFHVLYSTSGIGGHVPGIIDVNDSLAVEHSKTLSPFQFENNASLIHEGGDSSALLRRFINISPCHAWISNSPLKDQIVSAFIRKDMIEWARERGWQLGKTILINFATQNQNNKMGAVYITGSGEKKVQSYLTYDVESKNVHFADTIGNNKYIGGLVGDFKNTHDETFAGLISIELSPSIRTNEVMPYDQLLFGKIYDKPPFVEPVTPVVEPYYYPYMSEPYYSEPYYSEPYGYVQDEVDAYVSENKIVYFGDIEIYESSMDGSSFINVYNPYIPEEANVADSPYHYDAYIFENPYLPEAIPNITKGFYSVYQNLVETVEETGLKFYVDYINENKYPRSYQFYLDNKRYGSIKDIVDDINNSIGSYGIEATSLVENPESYSTRRLVSKEPSNIINAYYEFEKIITYNFPYSNSDASILNPYGDFGDVDSYVNIENSLRSFSTSEDVGEVIDTSNVSVSSELVFDGYQYDLVYYYNERSENNILEDAYYALSDNSSGGVVVKPSVLTAEALGISYERIRRVDISDSDVNIEYDVYHEQGPESNKISFNFVSKTSNFLPVELSNEKSSRPRESIVLPNSFSDVANYYIGGEASSLADDSFVESSFLKNNNENSGSVGYKNTGTSSALNAPTVVGLHVAYGGQISANNVSINPAPSTYFSNSEQSGIGQIEFRTIDAETAIIFVIIAYSDGSYSPVNAASNEFSNIKARITYSSTEDPEIITGIRAPDQVTEYYYNDPNDTASEQYFVYPVQLSIPIKSVINFVQISLEGVSVLANVKILNVPAELNEFGFIAINNNNPNYNMGVSSDGRSFGLVLDNFGSFDILISPEATMASAEFGDFNFGGKGFVRTSSNVDETYIAGIGSPIIDPEDGDISGFDNSSIPVAYRQSISLIPVPGYRQVWALRIFPTLRSLMIQARRSSPPGSFDNCYIDIPIYFQGNTTESSGTCNVRIFADIRCVFDYNFCDFFWNLGAPLLPPPAFNVSNNIEVKFEEWINCENTAISIMEDNIKKIKITSYFFMEISNIPILDNGNALLLIKSDFTSSNVRSIYNPSEQELLQLKLKSGVIADRPWEFQCSQLDSSTRSKVNRTIIYTNPQDDSQNSVVPSDIINAVQNSDKYMLIQPKFRFPATDEIGTSSPNEVIVASIGFSFKDWKPTSIGNSLKQRILFGVTFVVPADQTNTDLLQNFTIRYLYREDRRLK